MIIEGNQDGKVSRIKQTHCRAPLKDTNSTPRDIPPVLQDVSPLPRNDLPALSSAHTPPPNMPRVLAALIRRWPHAVIVLGAFLTLVWLSILGWLAYLLFMHIR